MYDVLLESGKIITIYHKDFSMDLVQRTGSK